MNTIHLDPYLRTATIANIVNSMRANTLLKFSPSENGRTASKYSFELAKGKFEKVPTKSRIMALSAANQLHNFESIIDDINKNFKEQYMAFELKVWSGGKIQKIIHVNFNKISIIATWIAQATDPRREILITDYLDIIGFKSMDMGLFFSFFNERQEATRAAMQND